MEHDIFISYSSLEKEIADQVKNVLLSNGYSCWMAPESIPGGRSYASEIKEAICGCKVMVVVLSEKAQRSIWIPKEISVALSNNKTVIPFHIDNSDICGPFLFYLTDSQRIEAYENLSKAYSDLLAALERVIGKPAIKEQTTDLSEKQIITESPLNKTSKPEVTTDRFSVCKIYVSLDSGYLSFASDSVKSEKDVLFLQLSKDLRSRIILQLEDILSKLYQIDKEMISINYDSDDCSVRLVPAAESMWSPWSVGKDYRISFHIQRFDAEIELPYDSVHFELGADLKVSFYKKGKYLNQAGTEIAKIEQLGIDQNAVIASAETLIRLCYPGKSIKVQNKFIAKFYDDGSGSYHLNFLLNP